MKITNSDLKSLLTLHNYLPQDVHELQGLTDEHRLAIIRYERVLIKLLEQKMQENEETRTYLSERRKAEQWIK